MAGRFPQAEKPGGILAKSPRGPECILLCFKDEPLQWLPIEHPPKLDDHQDVRARGVMTSRSVRRRVLRMNPKEAEIR